MKNYDNMSEKDTDIRIREEFQSRLPSPGDAEWFNRRLMNRLPNVRRPFLPKVIQAACYIISGLLLLGCWTFCMYDTARNGLSTTSLITAALIPAMAIVCLSVFGFHALRRSA